MQQRWIAVLKLIAPPFQMSNTFISQSAALGLRKVMIQGIGQS